MNADVTMAAVERTARFERVTRETRISGLIDLDGGGGTNRISTGVGMLDHMLDAFATHGRFRLDL